MLRNLKQIYVSFFNWLASFIPPDDFNDVLVIRLDELGDFILWLDSAKEYRNIYYNKKITLLINHKWLDFAKTIHYWDEVIPLNTIRFRIDPFYRIKTLLWLRKKGFDIVVSPRHSVKFTLEPSIVAVSGATHKIVCEGSFPVEKSNYFTRSIPITEKHELNKNAQFIRGLGRPKFKSSEPKIPYDKDKGLKYVVIAPKSYRKRKEWSLSKYIEIMRKIAKETQIKAIVVTSDRKISGLPNFITNLSGMTKINNFIDCIANASLVIANDSAPIHIAAAYNVPSVSIGAENLGRFLPYEVEKPRDGMILPKLIYKPKPDDITVEEVWDVIKGELNGH